MNTSNAIRAITRAELCAATDPRGGRRLDGPTRDFLESRFGRSFHHVRVHTGVRVAALARALNARAFTLGRNVFFGAHQYTPQTAAGLRLLAHELTHIVQQEAEPAGLGTTCPVGSPFDPLEEEADAMAERVLAAYRVSPSGVDPSPVIRRAVVVEASTAKITISDHDKCLPAIHVTTSPTGRPAVNSHLTNKFQGGSSASTNKASDAFVIQGEVEVTAGPLDFVELARWNFGFIQFQKIDVVNLFFRGNRKSDGGIAIQAHRRPALPKAVGRDAASGAQPQGPFTKTNTSGDKTFDPARGIATAKTGDHPMLLAPTVIQNNKTGVDNSLFVLVDDRQFFTVFTARDPAGRFQHLAHVNWGVRWDFEIAGTAGGVTAIRRGDTSFRMGRPAQGPPAEPSIQPFLANPGAAVVVGSAEMTRALRASFLGGPPNRIDTDKRF